MKTDSQIRAIKRYLYEYGSITPLEALDLCGSMRLAARIHDLRKQGHEIKTKMQYRGNTSWARYEVAKK